VPATLTDEHLLVRDTAAALARRLGPASVAALSARDGAGDAGAVAGGGDGEAARAADTEAWGLVADAGWTALRVAPEAGGLGASGVDVALVLEELAARLAPVPVLGAAVVVPALLAAAGPAASDVAGRIATGELRLALVLDRELQTTDIGPAGGVAVDARGAAAGLVVEGAWRQQRLRAVALGPPLPAADLTRDLRPALLDGRADASADGSADASADVGELGGILDPDLVQRAHALALVGLSADLVGTMRGALALAVEHARGREQFGAPVGSFQAVQHLCADAHVAVEGARSAVWYAAWAVDALEPAEAVLAARVAKAWCSRAGIEVCETAVQVLGGIGMTWEHPAHLHLRRALLDRTVLGDEHEQHERIGHQRLHTPTDARAS
jgi:alkylation response protein AidB-like acyl-CoA dehydrogenase